MKFLEKPHYKCINDEGLMHVVAWYHAMITGAPDQSSQNSGNKFRLARHPTFPNFVAQRQKVCEISVVEEICSPEK